MVGIRNPNRIMAEVMLVEKTRKPYWIKYIHTRIKNQKNFLVNITGPTGSGKSWSGLRLGYELDPKFDEKRIIFGFKSLMDLINGSEEYKPGSVFLWDEFQIDSSSRSWQSLTNRLLGSLLSTFRHKNFVLIITSPYQDFIDSQARKLIHAEFQTCSIDYSNKKTKIKPQLIQYNSRYKKFYYKYLRVRTPRGVSPLKYWNIERPPKWLIDKYETMKTNFTSNLNKEIGRELNKIADKKNAWTFHQVEPHFRLPLTKFQEEAMMLTAKYKDKKKVGEIMGKKVRMVYDHILAARKKGYSVEEFEKAVEEQTNTDEEAREIPERPKV